MALDEVSEAMRNEHGAAGRQSVSNTCFDSRQSIFTSATLPTTTAQQRTKIALNCIRQTPEYGVCKIVCVYKCLQVSAQHTH